MKERITKERITKESQSSSTDSASLHRPHFIGLTGATASIRGASNQSAHAAAMFARRAVGMSAMRELSEWGIHVGHVLVDGAVAAPDTLGRMWDKMNRAVANGKHISHSNNNVAPSPATHTYAEYVSLKSAESDIILPKSVGEAYWYLYSQPRDCWTFEIDVRPWREKPWWGAEQIVLNGGNGAKNPGGNDAKRKSKL